MNIIPLRNRLDREKKKSGMTFETIQQDYHSKVYYQFHELNIHHQNQQ